MDILIGVFGIGSACICFIGNVLVCHVVARNKSLKTSMNVLLLNLAIVDIITGVLGIYIIVIRDQDDLFGTSKVLEQVYNKSIVAAEFLCKVESSFWFGSAITPVLLVVIAYERFMGICHPLKWRRTEVKRGKYYIIPCWVFGIIFLAIKILTCEYSEGHCRNSNPPWYNIKAYAAAIITLHFLLPFSVIFLAYYRVVKTLTKENNLNMQPAVQRARNREKKTLVVVIITVTLIFLLCSGLPKTLYSFQILIPEVRFYNMDGNIPVLLFLINSASSPVIYFTFIRSFRRKLKLSLKLRKKPSRGLTSSSLHAHSVVLQSINPQTSVYVDNVCERALKRKQQTS